MTIPTESAVDNTLSKTTDLAEFEKVAENEGNLRYIGYLGRLRNFVQSGHRYLAFTSDVGEAVRPVVRPFVVNGAYGISFFYVGADIAYYTSDVHHLHNNPEKTLRMFCERTIFQGFASLLLPAVTIHTTVDWTARMLKNMNVRPILMRWGPSMAGLCLLPALPTVLDYPCEVAVEKLFQTVWPEREGLH